MYPGLCSGIFNLYGNAPHVDKTEPASPGGLLASLLYSILVAIAGNDGYPGSGPVQALVANHRKAGT